MKKITALFIALAFAFTVIGPALAGDLPAPVQKITDGTMEVLKSPMVLYTHTVDTMDVAEYKVFGLMKGLLESPFHFVQKAGSGVIDIATFPIE